VLGTRNEDGTWQAKSLANAHHVDNEAEKVHCAFINNFSACARACV